VDQPRPRRLANVFGWARGRERLAAAGLVLLAAIAAVLAVREQQEPDISVIDLPGLTGSLDPSRIAVLIFEDNSQDGSLRAVASGLTDALIAELNGIDQLSVISRQGVRQFADAVPLPDSIGRALSVGTIVSGSLQRSGSVLRVYVHMTDAQSGLVTSATIDRPEGELFALQDAIAREVANFLRQRLGHSVLGRLRQREASSEQAWREVQEALEQAEEIWAAERAVPEELVASSRMRLRAADHALIRAEQLDPQWIEPTILRGWVALGEARLARDTAAYAAALARGLDFAGRVLERRPDAPHALELRGTLLYHRARSTSTRDGAAAERAAAARDLQAAFEADRSLVGAASTLSRLKQYDGDLEGAEMYALSAFAEDAYLREGPDLRQRLYRIYLDLENVGAAMDSCTQGRTDYPADYRFIECHLAIPALTGRRIDIDSAQALLDALNQLDPPARDAMYRFTFRDVLFARVLYHAGRTGEAIAKMSAIRAHVERHAQLAPPFHLDDAAFRVLAGDTTGALERLERYVEHNPEQRAYLSRFFLLKDLRSHPQFAQLVTDPAS
jgi:TolB-like protein